MHILAPRTPKLSDPTGQAENLRHSRHWDLPSIPGALYKGGHLGIGAGPEGDFPEFCYTENSARPLF